MRPAKAQLCGAILRPEVQEVWGQGHGQRWNQQKAERT